MKTRLKTLLVSGFVISALAKPASADKPDSSLFKSNLSEALPSDVLAAISNASSTKTIYPINGNEVFRDQVLRADEIVFAPSASLTLTAIDRPYIVLIAKRWKFSDPTQMVKILRTAANAPNGTFGNTGARGPDRPGETGRRGNDGGSGSNGESGGRGGTLRLPTIYLIGESFTSPSGDPLPGNLRLFLDFAGIKGGDGGPGGSGGDGGNAGNGKEGATSPFDCKEGPGPGGNGGDAGAGGRGGDGGTGGNGANFVLISTAVGIEQLSYARIQNIEGFGGVGGRPGRAGKPGRGGRGGRANGWCGPAGDGYPGSFPDPSDLGQGDYGADGKKGRVTAITVADLKPIF